VGPADEELVGSSPTGLAVDSQALAVHLGRPTLSLTAIAAMDNCDHIDNSVLGILSIHGYMPING
jgi:hypothetical protein